MSFFGKNRQAKSTQTFASPDYVKLTIGGSNGVDSGLANSIQGELSQNIQDLYVIGEPSVYFGVGPSTGSINIGRYATCGKLFKDVNGDACGFIQSVAINAGGKDGCSCGGVSATFTGGIIQGVGFTVQAGQTFITETLNIKVSDFS
jgi:hypothetical protein